ncbi:alpha/beta fold hydrolase [Blastomonas sp. AAP53]|uniref:alpha/beta fold hydrolase n=1 Tax=Blastomonas sp. AAP53 TaxID=1248760 RepID=UPI000372EE9D|nr:alpha/beta fold hydrolase [Blastomonas sp. AAP53]
MAETLPVRRHYVDGPFGQLHVRESGTASAYRASLACFHMSPMTGRTFEAFMGVLAAISGRHVLAFDTPGFGMSDAPPNAPSIADYADALLAGIAACGVTGPVDLMGYHTGSMIACQLAAEHPDLVRRLVLISAPVFSADDLAAMRAEYQHRAPQADGSHILHRWQRFHHHFAAGGLSLDAINAAFPDGLMGRNIEHWGHDAAFGFVPGMRLEEVTQPVLLLNPEDDLRDHSMPAPALLKHARMVMLDGWGHGFLDLHALEAAALVESFLGASADPFGALALPECANAPVLSA